MSRRRCHCAQDRPRSRQTCARSQVCSGAVSAMTSSRPMRSRSVEMFLSMVMMVMGFIYSLPGDTLHNPVNQRLAEWVAIFPGTEGRLGALLVFVGAIRLLALLINGRWYPTPLARLFGCVA